MAAMSPLAFASLLMVASGSIHAVVNAIVKGGRDAMAGRAVTDASGALVMLPVLLFVPAPAGAWGWLAASAVLHAIYLYALIAAYRAADFSAAYPILRGTAPLVTAFVTLGFLGERASVQQVAGIALIGAAMFVLVAGRHIGRTALGWSLLTGLAIAAYTVVDARGVRAAPAPASYIAWLFVAMGGVVVTMFGVATRGRLFAAARAQWRPGAVAGILSILTYGMALYAFALGPTAPLAALRETGMVTALLLAVFALGERVTAARAAGVVGILAGAALILTG